MRRSNPRRPFLLAALAVATLSLPAAASAQARRGRGLDESRTGPSTVARPSPPAHPRLDAVASGLAVAGYSGTLSGRYYGADAAAGAAGAVRAKTGTLTGVTTLAGTVLTADGRLLVFALVANGTGAPDPARAALDNIAAGIAACGCR